MKKVRNSLTWFPHGSGAALAPVPLRRVSFSTERISLVTSAWTNSSPSCPHILLILRPCRPPSSNFEHLSALKLRLHRSHANLLHVVSLPLLLPRIPRHHTPNRPPLSLTLLVSRSLLGIPREALSGEAAFCGVLRSCFWDRCSISV